MDKKLQISAEQRYAEDVEFRDRCDQSLLIMSALTDEQVKQDIVDCRQGLLWLEGRRFGPFRSLVVGACEPRYMDLESDSD